MMKGGTLKLVWGCFCDQVQTSLNLPPVGVAGFSREAQKAGLPVPWAADLRSAASVKLAKASVPAFDNNLDSGSGPE